MKTAALATRTLAAVLSLTLTLSLTARASGDPAKGEERAKTGGCIACHGAHGESAGPEFPKLAGQPADYLQTVLHHYKAGVRRKNAIMMGMAANLSEQDMADLAAWFSSQNGLYTKY